MRATADVQSVLVLKRMPEDVDTPVEYLSLFKQTRHEAIDVTECRRNTHAVLVRSSTRLYVHPLGGCSPLTFEDTLLDIHCQHPL